VARLFSPPHECRGQQRGRQRGRQGGHRAPRLSAPVKRLGSRSTWPPVDSNSRNSRSGLSAGNPRTQIAWRYFEMRPPEIDRVHAAHDRMIGIDPNRDARVITFVSRSQPCACRLVDQLRRHSMFDRCTTDDHALDREPVTERAGDKCLTRPGAEPASRPKPAHRAGRATRRALTPASTGPRSIWRRQAWRTARTSVLSARIELMWEHRGT
jgi:hypothetical protein